MTVEEGGASPPTERVVRIVSYLAAHPSRSYSLSELARAAEVPGATCHAVLASLARSGWVTRTGRSYGLGPGLLAIGRAAATGYPVARAAAPELVALAAATGLPATTAILDGRVITVVDAAGPGAAGMIGRMVPYAPPLGLVFAAWGDADDWTSRAADPADLLEAVAATRARGYVIERFTPALSRLRTVLSELTELAGDDRLRDEVLGVLTRLGHADYFPSVPPAGRVDVTVLGVPVFDPDGRVAANLSLHPAAELTSHELTGLAQLLGAAAGRVTALIT